MKKFSVKFLTLTVVIVSIGLIVLWGTGGDRLSARQQQYTGQEDHVVTLDQAVKYVQSFTGFTSGSKVKAVYYGRNIFDKILATNGSVGVRFYFGQTNDGTPTLVLVGVDSTGADLTGGPIGEAGLPCPPFCPSPGVLNK